MSEIHPSGFFANHLERYNDRTCLILQSGKTLTYRDVLDRADRIAAQLGTGRKLVFIEAENSAASISAYIGCLRAGHAVHLINADKKEENRNLVSTYKPHVVMRGSEANPETVHDTYIELHPDLAVLLSTSGSTGSQKLVKLSYENINSNTHSIIEYLGMMPDDRAMTSLKFHYSYGMSIVNTHLAVGASLVLSDLSVQDDEFWKGFRRHGVTSFSGVPYSFQMLDQLKTDLGQFPSLRLVTQAGGKLGPDLVLDFAEKGRRQGWKFIVMYGQTEAAPRISYLPFDKVLDHPDSIGVAIPGGRLEIVGDNGEAVHEPELEGELAYSGPNVMIGYAYSHADLATSEKIHRLMTGDLAVKTEDGVFKIVGRKARFVKPFGLRIGLDDIENWLASRDIAAYVVGDDAEIVIFTLIPSGADIIRLLSGKYGLPASLFSSKAISEIPRLANGKVDYKTLRHIAWGQDDNISETPLASFGRFLQLAGQEFISIFTGGKRQWTSVEEIFSVYFPARSLSDNESFVSLGGDSLIHLEISLCLEEFLGALPSHWHEKSIRELQALNG